MGKYTEDVIFICECFSPVHQVIFQTWKHKYLDAETQEINMYVHLVQRPFWKRIVYSFKYIFKKPNRYGAFDVFSFQPEDADKLQKLVDELRFLEKFYADRENKKI